MTANKSTSNKKSTQKETAACSHLSIFSQISPFLRSKSIIAIINNRTLPKRKHHLKSWCLINFFEFFRYSTQFDVNKLHINVKYFIGRFNILEHTIYLICPENLMFCVNVLTKTNISSCNTAELSKFIEFNNYPKKNRPLHHP